MQTDMDTANRVDIKMVVIQMVTSPAFLRALRMGDTGDNPGLWPHRDNAKGQLVLRLVFMIATIQKHLRSTSPVKWIRLDQKGRREQVLFWGEGNLQGQLSGNNLNQIPENGASAFCV